MGRVLVVGTPRSGSTWTAEVLGLAARTQLVHEPDNAPVNPAAARTTRLRGMFPMITAGESAPDYKVLWDLAFAGGWPNVAASRAVGRGLRRLPPRVTELLLRTASPVTIRLRRAPTNVVAKSVYAALSVEWIASQYHPRVVVVERDPLNVVGSCLDLGIPFGDLDRNRVIAELSEAIAIPQPNPTAAPHLRTAWCVAFLMTVMRLNAARHPEWLVVDHGELIVDPEHEFPHLFTALGLIWTPAAKSYLAASNRPGSGYKRRRIRSDLPEAWRRRLTPSQAAEIRAVLERFPSLR